MKILITAFEPFGDDTINPTMLILDALKGNARSELVKQVLPTVFFESAEQLKTLVREHAPQAIIMLGQAGGRANISIERVAINLIEAVIPDNKGNQPYQSMEGPVGIYTTLPFEAIRKRLEQNHVPVEYSYSAGTYVCNHLFYEAMQLTRSAIPAGFIHVPYLDGQGEPSLPLEVMVRGIECVIDVLTEQEN